MILLRLSAQCRGSPSSGWSRSRTSVGYALGFTQDHEDKTHLLPYLRATRDLSLSTRWAPVHPGTGGDALGFTQDHEDKTHLLPYLRATRDLSLSTRWGPWVDLGTGGGTPSGSPRTTRTRPTCCPTSGPRATSLSAPGGPWYTQVQEGDALGFTQDHEDKTHLLPYLRAMATSASPCGQPPSACTVVLVPLQFLCHFSS